MQEATMECRRFDMKEGTPDSQKQQEKDLEFEMVGA
jgi:hypothetical protein